MAILTKDRSYQKSYAPITANPVYPFMKRREIELSEAGHEFDTGQAIEIKEPFRFIGIRNAQGAILQLDNDVPVVIDSKQLILSGLQLGGECGGFRLWWEPTAGVVAIIEWSMVAMSYYPADLTLGGGVTQTASSFIDSVANSRIEAVGIRNGRTELILQSDPDNTDYILIGGADATIDSGLKLIPGGIFSTLNYSGPMDMASPTDNQRLRILEVY